MKRELRGIYRTRPHVRECTKRAWSCDMGAGVSRLPVGSWACREVGDDVGGSHASTKERRERGGRALAGPQLDSWVMAS